MATTIQNCNFTGVKFEEKAIQSLDKIADGLIENAKALGTLARVFSGSMAMVDAMIKVGMEKEETKPESTKKAR